MKHIIKAFTILFIFAAVLNLVACGKMSAPTPIEGSGYPHDYPHR